MKNESGASAGSDGRSHIRVGGVCRRVRAGQCGGHPAFDAVGGVDLTASKISIRLGATWLNPEYIRQFIFETLDTPRRVRWDIKVHYSQITDEWRIEGKSKDSYNVKAYSTYGTSRASAYDIIESSLNLKDVRIFDYQYDPDGRRVAVLNKKETAIAQGKQELLKEAFAEWIWKDLERREKICKAYNILFNSNRPREYDGSHINFSGMNPEITLRKHKVNAIATGDYDAIIIGHSQFEKIPVSIQRQRAILEQQMDEIILGIHEAKADRAENFTIKQMEKTRKGLQNKLDKLNDQSRKDDVVTFEELDPDDRRLEGLDFDSAAPSENDYMRRYGVQNYAYRMRTGRER